MAMTDREKLMFLEGIQFAAGSLPLETAAIVNTLAIRVVAALQVPCAQLAITTTELHLELDRGGFRGAEAQRKAHNGN